MNNSPFEIFLRFLRLGLLAWGEPNAQISMIRREIVEKEQWICQEQFGRISAVYQALPGPPAHKLCVHLGTVAGGRWGGLLAGLGFMMPGFLLMLLLSWLYVTYGMSSALVATAFYGMRPAVIALVVRGMQRIVQYALHDLWLWGIALISFALQLIGVHFVLILFATGIFYIVVRRYGLQTTATAGVLLLIAILTFHFGIDRIAPTATVATIPSHPQPQLVTVLGSGLRAGLLNFGGPFSATPFLYHDAVNVGGWMTDSQFLDGMALGALLPASWILFGSFVGYQAGGFAEAILLTLGIFVPAFAVSLVSYDLIERLVSIPWLHSFFDGLTAGVVGLVMATALFLLPKAISDLPTALIFIITLLILMRWQSKANAPVAMLAGAVMGWLSHVVGLA
ncbi:MAG: chromate efflux transporter [Caldilineaceae bacterium]